MKPEGFIFCWHLGKNLIKESKFCRLFQRKNRVPLFENPTSLGKGGGGAGGGGADKKLNIPLDIKSVGMSNLILKVFLKVCFLLDCNRQS